jgi:H+/Na+-translocating ferredoxin:NAD+ oxidoreductase subunit D
MSKPKEYSWMTKDKLMTYTFIALLILAVITAVLWWPITPYDLITNTPFMNLGLTVAINCIIAVGIAVGIDALLYKVTADSPLNTMSAAVFGLIVALSYTLGVPGVATIEASMMPLAGPDSFLYVALISLIGIVVFKKIQGLAGRKYVNPAAAAKIVVLVPFLYAILLPQDHSTLIPTLATSLGYGGTSSFGAFMQFCFGNPTPLRSGIIPPYNASDVFQTLFLDKFHGWTGGASALAVILVGLGLFVVARRYIKWRITAAYIGTTIVMSLLMTAAYGGDAALRLMFELFIGSSIFLAFFMATDPASTPLTYTGQAIFGVGLGVLTVLIQTYMNFFGGSILALVIMNLTSPWLDKVGRLKPQTETKEPKLPRAIQQTAVKTYECIRCGACMRVCCHKLSPILIKQAFDKTNVEQLSKLNADYCTGCGHCSFVCPARIDLKGTVLRSKAMLRQQ